MICVLSGLEDSLKFKRRARLCKSRYGMATQASSAPAPSVPELACVDDNKVCLHLCLRLHLRRHHMRRLNLRHLEKFTREMDCT